MAGQVDLDELIRRNDDPAGTERNVAKFDAAYKRVFDPTYEDLHYGEIGPWLRRKLREFGIKLGRRS